MEVHGGGGTQVKIEEGEASIKLELGIDRTVSEKKPVKEHGKMCVFTPSQLHELQLQTLIFKYIAGGIQVPVSLVLPIWKSVTSSFHSAHASVYQRDPNFVGVSPRGFDYRNMVDPELGRCRRTDGKKWRCSKNVIPYQKYCEQHMHRGCRRSRKLVETSQTSLPVSTSSKTSIKLLENSKNDSAPMSFQYMKPSMLSIPFSNNVGRSGNFISTNARTSSTIVTKTKNDGRNDFKRCKSSTNTIDKVEEKISVTDNGTINTISKSGNKATIGNNICPNVGFSPKSVLQGNSSSRVCKNEIELEPGRCRRTDGKRWRCSRDVIPDQKYCARHMHRGARKHAVVSQPVALPTTGDCRHSRLTIANKAACSAWSTSLSISISSPHLSTQDEKSMSNSSETTISDTTVTVFDNANFS